MLTQAYNIDRDPGFRRFCAQGDRMLREKQQKAPAPAPFQLPTSTQEALVWLDCFHPERLKKFMEGRSEAETQEARQFILEERRKRKTTNG